MFFVFCSFLFFVFCVCVCVFVFVVVLVLVLFLVLFCFFQLYIRSTLAFYAKYNITLYVENMVEFGTHDVSYYCSIILYACVDLLNNICC